MKRRSFLVGDFNLRLHQRNHTSAPWRQILLDQFTDCITPLGHHPTPTFTSTRTRSCIDYIFRTPDIFATNSSVHFLNTSEWTDHCLLTTSIPLPISHGSGVWRLNPTHLDNQEFLDKLFHLFDCLCETSSTNPTSAQVQWDDLKAAVKQLSLTFGRQQKRSRIRQQQYLQRERHQLLKHQPSDLDQLATIDHAIATNQLQHMSTLALRANQRWQERGEQSNKYFFRVLKQRQQKQYVYRLRNNSSSTDYHTSTSSMLQHAREFYHSLYSPEPTSDTATATLLHNIPPDTLLSDRQQRTLLQPITINNLNTQLKHAPTQSSPGLDGLPFTFWRLALTHPYVSHLADLVYNAALFEGTFPSSWLQTVLVLLPKKGDTTLLKNWRPISLINCDAKILTKILARRMQLHTIINPFQTGFMANRSIADNGLLARIVMAHAQAQQRPGALILADFEKANDRIHPRYLQQVMHHFHFPPQVITCIQSLFFSTQVHVNINGHISSPFTQGRGLRQGDPISPLLFNIAFEPCLRYILSSSSLTGFSFAPIRHLRPAIALPPPPPLKLLAYADDLSVFVNSTMEFESLLDILRLYGQASNSRINVDKTEVVSLSGSPLNTWLGTLAPLGITTIHDRTAANAVRYLGYPLSSHPSQLQSFFDHILTKLQRHCDLLRQRRLSIRGQGLVLHSLILSRVWHVLTVTPARRRVLQHIRSICRTYLDAGYPPISWSLLCQPRSKGGLGLLDPELQQLALQSRWIKGLFGKGSPSFVYAYLLFEVMQYSGAPTTFHAFFTTGRSSQFPLPLQTLIRACHRLLPPLFFHQRLHITPATATLIPLRLVVLQETAQAVTTKAMSKLCVGDLFAFDPGGHLRLRSPAECHGPRNTLRALRTAFLDATLQLSPCVLDLLHPTAFTTSPFITSEEPMLDAIPLTAQHRLHHLSTAILRRSLPRPAHIEAPSHRPSILGRQWLKFWRSPIPHQTRTVWWRLLTQRIPTRSLLHAHMPHLATSPSCSLCNHPQETVAHFFVDCPNKQPIWTTVTQSCNSDWSLADIFTYLTTLTTPSRSHQPLPDTTISITLFTIWRQHWRHTFDHRPFRTGDIVDSIQLKLLEAARQPEALDSQDED